MFEILAVIQLLWPAIMILGTLLSGAGIYSSHKGKKKELDLQEKLGMAEIDLKKYMAKAEKGATSKTMEMYKEMIRQAQGRQDKEATVERAMMNKSMDNQMTMGLVQAAMQTMGGRESHLPDMPMYSGEVNQNTTILDMLRQ